MQRGVVYALGAAALFGVSTPLAKMLLGAMSPLLLAGLLYTGSAMGLLLVFAGRRLVARSQAMVNLPERGEWRWLVGAILFGGVAGPIALMYGLVTTTASAASLLLNLEAVFTALLAWFLFRENFDWRIASGMLAIVGGGLVLAWTPGDVGIAAVGPALIATASLCWALDNNLTRRISASDAVVIAALKGLAAGAINLGLARAFGAKLPDVGLVGIAAVVGFLGYGLSLVLFVLALRHLGTARTGAYFSIAPFFGAALAVLLQGEPVTWQLIIAGALMAVGTWLHLAEKHGHRHAHERLEHAHVHTHDLHHRHRHGPEWDGKEPHAHAHVHEPVEHTHIHYPDVHHRHPH